MSEIEPVYAEVDASDLPRIVVRVVGPLTEAVWRVPSGALGSGAAP